MRELTLAAAVAAVFSFVAISAQAMPVSTLQGLTKSNPAVTQVRDGCGRGFHKNRWGHCRRNHWWRW